jgi:hypothetical protein
MSIDTTLRLLLLLLCVLCLMLFVRARCNSTNSYYFETDLKTHVEKVERLCLWFRLTIPFATHFVTNKRNDIEPDPPPPLRPRQRHADVPPDSSAVLATEGGVVFSQYGTV